jgi:hypothetical protein
MTRSFAPATALTALLIGVLAAACSSGQTARNTYHEDAEQTPPAADDPDWQTASHPPAERASHPSTLAGRPTPPQAPRTTPRAVPAEPGYEAAAEPQALPPRAVTVPQGTTIDLEIVDTISTKTSAAGDSVTAHVAQDVIVGGTVAIPAGAVVDGVIEQVNPADRFGGVASLALRFSTLDLPGGVQVPVQASYHTEIRGEKKKDAATIGGAAAGGAVLGGILKDEDRSEGAKKGAIAGAIIGTAVAAATKGQEAELPAGTTFQVRLDAPVTF